MRGREILNMAKDHCKSRREEGGRTLKCIVDAEKRPLFLRSQRPPPRVYGAPLPHHKKDAWLCWLGYFGALSFLHAEE